MKSNMHMSYRTNQRMVVVCILGAVVVLLLGGFAFYARMHASVDLFTIPNPAGTHAPAKPLSEPPLHHS